MTEFRALGATQILEMIVARFLCKRFTDLTWRISPKAAPWARQHGASISTAMEFVPSDEWVGYRNLAKCEVDVHSNHEVFADLMLRLVRELPGEVDRYVEVIRRDEFRILLVYAGREVYDFFVRDHRFGTPPRGKMYRSNLRSGFEGAGERPPRPDMAVVGLRRKIARWKAMGFPDVGDLEAELARREAVLKAGGDPLAGKRFRKLLVSRPMTPDEVLEEHRRSIGLEKSHDSDREREDAADFAGVGGAASDSE